MGSLRGGRRLRSRLHRRRRHVRWVAAALVALCAGAWAAGTVSRAEEALAAYGILREVPVVVRDLAPGVVVGSTDIEVRALPEVAVPDGVAVDPIGRVVRQMLVAGEVVAEARLGGRGSGPSAQLTAGRRALAIPQPEHGLALGVGDVIDVLAPADGPDATTAPGTLRVARSATVVAVDEDTLTVAVSVVEASAVARAVLDGSVAVALVGPAP